MCVTAVTTRQCSNAVTGVSETDATVTATASHNQAPPLSPLPLALRLTQGGKQGSPFSSPLANTMERALSPKGRQAMERPMAVAFLRDKGGSEIKTCPSVKVIPIAGGVRLF